MNQELNDEPKADRAVGSSDLLACLELERYKCINDVCCYCAGHCPPYHRTPVGPNDAGNWVHFGKVAHICPEPMLCKASSIFARARFEAGMRKQANDES